VISGGKALKLQWTPFNVTPGECKDNMCLFANQNAIYGQVPSPYTRNITRTPTAEKCAVSEPCVCVCVCVCMRAL
jgi:hypothetical protein